MSIGLAPPRPGLRGAATAILDAADALACARHHAQVVDFAHDWPTIMLGSAQDRLQALLAGGVAVAREQPCLAEAVRAFADNRYSASACARSLQLHPNSAKYRLERWRALTGWDVDTPNGLAASLTCLNLVHADPADPRS